MATILLQAAGAFLGGVFGPVGTAIGSAAGAIAGYMVDRALITGTQRYEGPRLTSARPFTAEDGAPLPRLYGTVRTSGTLIWATRFEEKSTTSRQGGKGGGPKVTDYSYFANAAFALCEGEIAGVRRIWADGKEVDRGEVEIRVYPGSEHQPVDPLIEAKQGEGNASAYRGTAYVVIERFPIDDYGRRIPQFQFEVIRPVGELNRRIRSVALIPGSTEYGLSPKLVRLQRGLGETEAVNRHVLTAATDFEASLDELQMLCPNLETVSLVVSWFGTDLRAGECRIKPMVTQDDPDGLSADWQVSGVSREEAETVSRNDGKAAYGGTPTDRSVMEAIGAIRERGLKVALYPFIMMDVPADNALPNPYGGGAQPAYPWRGRITCHPAPGRAGTPDKTAAVRNEIVAFAGTAMPAQFRRSGETIRFDGNSGEWSYRRFLLHYAHLAEAAGGVDAFLIGSELRGLTTLRDGANRFPFVELLVELAAEAQGILGDATAITYAADWSEYFGHQPADGSGDVFFHLDSLWAHPAIDAVGIDNYMPLSDWRDQDVDGSNPDGFTGPYDPDGLRTAIAAGEGFDWYYASAADRAARRRTPIIDGAHGKHWVYRYKDLAGWWSNRHHNRVGGVEQATPTAWVPMSKPIHFTELGCAAIDKGPNQPNVFGDPKSAESAVPYFSNGGRSDLAQHRFLMAHYRHWEDGGPAANPVSPVYGGPMVDVGGIGIWAWDARPFPAFPLQGNVWGDGDNWWSGHWLNGRLSGVPVEALIEAILADHGLPPADTSRADGMVAGYVVTNPTTARAAIEPIATLFGIAAMDGDQGLVFATEGAGAGKAVALEELMLEDGRETVERVRQPDHDLPALVQIDFTDPMNEHQSATAAADYVGAKGSGTSFFSFPGALAVGEAESLARNLLRRSWDGRERVTFAVPGAERRIDAGNVLRLPGEAEGPDYLVEEVEDGLARLVKARRIVRVAAPPAKNVPGPGGGSGGVYVPSKPYALFLDLPSRSSQDAPQDQFRLAVRAAPWRTQAVLASPEETGFDLRGTTASRAVIGLLRQALPAGAAEGRFDRSITLDVRLLDGELQSISRLHMLNGGNAAAVRSMAGAWEILQFEEAEEIEPSVWRLKGLLRGQLGTSDAMAAGAEAGAPFVFLDEAVAPAGLKPEEIGLELNWRIGPAGYDISDEYFLRVPAEGGRQALLPLSPVHLRARMHAGDLHLSWIRRGRVDADSWMGEDIPLGEERELYRIGIGLPGGASVRTATAAAPAWVYTAAMMAADFSEPPAAIEVSVAQSSALVGAGLPVRRTVPLA
ncbi:glycoside hydrolase/phage tail family protein [Chelativorans sp. AA-79]|uniref:baseplate multidomain protein megatron n=1 Tax=Chelativorans sp. AA-79 TaxID=3028735 RepID=UPI0023FA31CB|nr:glycoside hydrolase/phage tail family protein [Chelativorans sp. AA-79]WEX07726.1 glycoside hydrolase/phage tail family protein [Chelativorans sp. AA-79]